MSLKDEKHKQINKPLNLEFCTMPKNSIAAMGEYYSKFFILYLMYYNTLNI